MAESRDKRTVRWTGNAVVMVDQRNLPLQFGEITLSNYLEVVEAIKNMTVRGAPAIGAAAGYGLALAAKQSPATDMAALEADIKTAHDTLFASRPTAVNLKWALDRLMKLLATLIADNKTPDEVRAAFEKEAEVLADEDVKINKTMAEHGATLVKKGDRILHHCNTGALATVDWGTALGVIRTCHLQEKEIFVWVDETRPRLQGARLTAWELTQWGVPFKLMADSAAGIVMQRKEVDIILVGADRIAANGDTANKIGTYKLAAVAKDNDVPFYIVAPTSTVDLHTPNGDAIPIEERDSREVTHVGAEQIAPDNCPVFNPAFDVTPARLIAGIVTEHGIARPPFTESLARLVAMSGRSV
eukprot:CAMPEP_0114554254 /NCGR_PEP_ID=MMETSP0114-20121206/8113_1 /TAXON_ID=31324 /ORGANISM="Goniomonas sp, Strain m" /LENGTH=357 /DNA_ID=CAMNT_0001739291 /DNA_START=24 /DNA_END=1097 /DNA_ORIENTATION=+